MRTSLSLFLFCFFLFVSFSLGAYQWENEFPSTDETGNTVPKGRYHHGFAVVGAVDNDGIGVLTGGYSFDNKGTYLNDTWQYDVANKSWSKVASLPSARAFFTANSYEGEVVVFGGETPSFSVLGDLWRYAVNNNTWTNETFRNYTDEVPRQFHASVVVGNRLYVFGGHSKKQDRDTNSLLAYDLRSQHWHVLYEDQKDGPAPRQGHSLHAFEDAALGLSLIVFGGYSNYLPTSSGYNDVWQYVISKNVWVQLRLDRPPEGRYSHTSIFVENRLIIYGGLSTYNKATPPAYDVYYGDVWSLHLYGNSRGNWTQVLPTYPPLGARQGQQGANVGNILFTTGGYEQGVGLRNDVWSLQQD